MRILITKKYAASKGPNMKTLEKNKVSLTEEERKEVIDRGATWGQDDDIPAVWKAEVDGKMWYVCNTHRAYQCKPTLKGGIKAFDFIETTSNSRKTKKYAQLKEVKLKGVLKKTKDNYVYLNISNDVINGLVSLIDHEEVEKPPYDLKSFNSVGAHISVIGADEYKDNDIEEVGEIGQEFNFTFKNIKSTNPDGWDEMKKVYFVQVDAPELKKLRTKYGLPKLVDGHEFHITIGVEKK